jgi:hypothetical protein
MRKDPNPDDGWFDDDTKGYGHIQSTSAIPSSSQGAQVASSSSSKLPSKKSSTKGRKTKTDQPEKRGAITKKKCPQNILDRVERVRDQRFFMISRQRKDEANGSLREDFEVFGSTGNVFHFKFAHLVAHLIKVYTVTIARTPRCTCPDALKGNHCKHIVSKYSSLRCVC